jgi:hypothetical protein
MPLRNASYCWPVSQTVVGELPLIVVAPPSTAMLVTWLSSAHQVAATLRAVPPAPFPSLATLVVTPPSTAMLVTWLSSAHQVAATLRAVPPAPFPSPLTRRRRRRRWW